METNIKLFIAFFILSLSFLSLYSKAATCPPVETITRVADEYQWKTTEPGWSGYFAAPIAGKGRSYTITKFIAATWVKSHDSDKSAGFIQCDYIGSFGSEVKNSANDPATTEYEVIRFVQDNAQGALQPATRSSNTSATTTSSTLSNSSNPSSHWTCRSITSFPKEACLCQGDLTNCNFRLG